MLTDRVGLVCLLVLTVAPAGAHAQGSGESLAITPKDMDPEERD
jgi:hypothetical protein